MTRARDLANIGPGVPTGFRNAIINGGMDIWQRGTSGIVPTSTQAYTADRWESFRSGYAAGMSVYRPSGPTGFNYAARVQRDAGNTSTANMVFCQALESVNSTRFNGKTVTLSFWARAGANFSSASSILNTSITYGTGTDQNFRGGFTGYTQVSPTNVTLTTSWQRFFITGNISGSATQVGVQFLYTPVGTAGAADHFEITGVQLEEGSTVTPFEQRPIGTELSLCQRYYEKSYNQAVAPGTASNDLGVAYVWGTTQADGFIGITINFKVPKRTSTYTLTGYSPSTGAAGTFDILRAGSVTPGVAITGTLGPGETSATPYVQSGANNALARVYGHWTVSAEL